MREYASFNLVPTRQKRVGDKKRTKTNENGVVEDKRHSFTLPEVSSAPSWFEFSFLLTFADEADMVDR